MTNRNGVALLYDEENQLKQYGNNVTFGYADGGQRLWKNNAGQLTIWIGGIYEIKAGKTLCHVFAGGRRVATFEPISPVCAWLQNTPCVRDVYAFARTATTWPLAEGRTPLTVTLIPLFGILCVSVVSRRRRWFNREWTRMRAKFVVGRVPSRGGNCRTSGSLVAFGVAQGRHVARLPLRSSPFWMQCVSVLLIVALFVAVTPTQVEAGTCEPVFYYYHADHLGSGNVLTDRSGVLVRHFEYFAFGKERYNDVACSFTVSNRYTDQILDEDTGLYYYNARYYDPELGRFIQADTDIPTPDDPQALNRYSYVRNSPLNRVDPTGHRDFNWSLLRQGLGNLGLAVIQGSAGVYLYVTAGWTGAGAVVGTLAMVGAVDRGIAGAFQTSRALWGGDQPHGLELGPIAYSLALAGHPRWGLFVRDTLRLASPDVGIPGVRVASTLLSGGLQLNEGQPPVGFLPGTAGGLATYTVAQMQNLGVTNEFRLTLSGWASTAPPTSGSPSSLTVYGLSGHSVSVILFGPSSFSGYSSNLTLGMTNPDPYPFGFGEEAMETFNSAGQFTGRWYVTTTEPRHPIGADGWPIIGGWLSGGWQIGGTLWSRLGSSGGAPKHPPIVRQP